MIGISESLSRRTAIGQLAVAGIGSLMAAAGLATSNHVVDAASLEDVLDQWFGAWSSADPPSALASFYAPDGSFGDVAANSFIYSAEIDGFLRSYLSGLSGYQRSVQGWFATDNLAAVQQLISGVNQGFYADAPLGAAFQYYAVTIFQFDGNLLTQSLDYYDKSGILAQLGVWPSWPVDEVVETPDDDCGILCKKSG